MLTIAEKLLRGMSEERLHELARDWAEEGALTTNKEHAEICRRMVAKYRGELERRAQDEARTTIEPE